MNGSDDVENLLELGPSSRVSPERRLVEGLAALGDRCWASSPTSCWSASIPLARAAGSPTTTVRPFHAWLSRHRTSRPAAASCASSATAARRCCPRRPLPPRAGGCAPLRARGRRRTRSHRLRAASSGRCVEHDANRDMHARRERADVCVGPRAPARERAEHCWRDGTPHTRESGGRPLAWRRARAVVTRAAGVRGANDRQPSQS